MTRSKERSTVRPSMERLRGFHRDRSGQISFLTVFGAVALAGLLGLVMTTGDQTALKVRTQNAADAAALSGGAWIARGLNVTSAANVAQTQLVAGAILMDAFHRTLRDSRPGMQGLLAFYIGCSGVPVIGVICAAAAVVVRLQLTALDFLLPIVRPLARTLARCPDGLFWRTARLLERVSQVVHTSFFAVAFGESLRVARANGAEGAALVPGPLFHGIVSSSNATLPTRRVDFPALCPPMTDGSPTPEERGYGQLLGYPLTQGPFELGRCRLGWVVIGITGVPPLGAALFPLYANLSKSRLCGEAYAPAGGEIRRPTNDLDECRRLGGVATWRMAEVSSGSVSEADACTWFLREFERKEKKEEEQVELARGAAASAVLSTQTDRVELSCDDRPPGRRLDDRLSCNAKASETTEDGRFRHEIKAWVLETSWVEDRELETDPGGGCSGGGKPRPYLLGDEPDALRYLAVVHRPNRRIFFGPRFLEEPPDLVTYAQVEIYNGVSEDTFTQDWRVRLERASLLERPFRALGESRFLAAANHLLAPLGLDPTELAAAVRYLNHH